MAIQRPLRIDTTTGEITRFGEADQVFDSNFLNVTNPAAEAAGANDIPPGSPLYCSGANEVALAQADDLATAKVVALATETIAEDGGSGVAQTDGRLTLTAGEWDAVTGQSGGLTPGAKYYLSAATAGMLTTTPPSADGEVLAPLGLAKSTIIFEVSIATRVVL